MTDEERTLVQEVVDAIDGTCIHEWDLTAAAGFGHLIVTSPSGRRFSLGLTARALPLESQE